MKTAFNFFIVLIVSIGLVACSAEDGDIGPPGPQGEQGVQGEQGPQGEQGSEGEQGPQGEQGPAGEDGVDGQDGQDGQDGEDGNANVMYSDWFFPDWNMSDLVRFKRMEVEDSNFSDTWLEGGATLVYWRTNNGSTFLLPWNSYNTAGNLVIERSVIYRSSTSIWITIKKYGSDFTAEETEGQVGGIIRNRIRYVIIPGNVNLPAKSALDYSDYDAVKAHYNIPD
ncbi:collagen-like protein [Sinomicrobium weinanense]|uniref:Collagen-like protein n=1 Tax=Sinomicrobium weinanense TaxID=2842200 RepID=A0A926Q2B9_9FLAO|nr:collagen-like protein [Sinomicrobium weinanense]MBC9794741.1 collagen-like protein [Sinomicrobium weinanense]MBU3125000.1 collagen-like protein [Sinomicrobium weinanense]